MPGFATGDIDAALAAQGREVVVASSGELDDDLVRKMAEIPTSFSAPPYGNTAMEPVSR